MIFNFTQACLQLETVNLVSDVAIGPLVNANEIGSFIPHLLDGYRAYTYRVSELWDVCNPFFSSMLLYFHPSLCQI